MLDMSRSRVSSVKEMLSVLLPSKFLPVSTSAFARIAEDVTGADTFDVSGVLITVFRGPGLHPTENARHVVRRILSTLHPREGLRIYIFPIDVPRRFPERGHMMTSRHVNGGLYIHPDRVIVITRFEEYPKVLVHEIIHDMTTAALRGIERRSREFMSRMNVGSTLRLQEAIVETLAVILHAHILKRDVREETRYCGALADRLSRMYDWPRVPWKDGTNTFAYVFLRYKLMSSMGTFLDAWRAFTITRDIDALISCCFDCATRDSPSPINDVKLKDDIHFKMTLYGGL